MKLKVFWRQIVTEHITACFGLTFNHKNVTLIIPIQILISGNKVKSKIRVAFLQNVSNQENRK